MTDRDRLARGIEARADSIAAFMAAWLEAGALASNVPPVLPRDVSGTCRAVVQDLVAWLRERESAWYIPRTADPWWSLRCERARQLACSAIQEYLRSSDDSYAEALGASPETSDLLSRYFRHAGEQRPTLDAKTPTRFT